MVGPARDARSETNATFPGSSGLRAQLSLRQVGRYPFRTCGCRSSYTCWPENRLKKPGAFTLDFKADTRVR
jgi:hypothetical protein